MRWPILMKNMEYCQTKEICQKVLKLNEGSLVGSKHTEKCLMSNISIFANCHFVPQRNGKKKN